MFWTRLMQRVGEQMRWNERELRSAGAWIKSSASNLHFKVVYLN